MAEEQHIQTECATNKKPVPPWMVAVVVVVAGAVTAFAMFETGHGPADMQLSWGNAPNPMQSVPQLGQMFSPPLVLAEENLVNVAATTAAAGNPPTIPAGAVAPHPERGVCTGCHNVVSSRGQPLARLTASAVMPHQYRGVCMNCHQIQGVPGGTGLPGRPRVARPGGGWPPAPVSPAAGAAATKAPTEGEWLGLEVAPITSLTASQYNLPQRLQGVVIPDAEAQAAAAGILAGDVVLSVNGQPTRNIREFLAATNHGRLTRGVVQIFRRGQVGQVELNSANGTRPAAAAPGLAGLNGPAPGGANSPPLSPAPVAFGRGRNAACPTPGAGGGQGWGRAAGLGGNPGTASPSPVGLGTGPGAGAGWGAAAAAPGREQRF